MYTRVSCATLWDPGLHQKLYCAHTFRECNMIKQWAQYSVGAVDIYIIMAINEIAWISQLTIYYRLFYRMQHVIGLPLFWQQCLHYEQFQWAWHSRRWHSVGHTLGLGAGTPELYSQIHIHIHCPYNIMHVYPKLV